ncbi:MAG: hypothetical protein M5U28_27020 [Sandaracinaceae bacterium]|nr:hypothetical protein [Sandaracinaceae bacterium]
MRPDHEVRIAGERAGVARRELELEDRREAPAVVALRAQDPELAVQRDVAEALVVEAVRVDDVHRVVVVARHRLVRARADHDRDLHADDEQVREAEVEVQRAGELAVDDATAEEAAHVGITAAAVVEARGRIEEAVEGNHPEPAVEDQAEADAEVREDVGAVDRQVSLRVDRGAEQVEVHAARGQAPSVLRLRGRGAAERSHRQRGDERRSQDTASSGRKSEHQQSPVGAKSLGFRVRAIIASRRCLSTTGAHFAPIGRPGSPAGAAYWPWLFRICWYWRARGVFENRPT